MKKKLFALLMTVAMLLPILSVSAEEMAMMEVPEFIEWVQEEAPVELDDLDEDIWEEGPVSIVAPEVQQAEEASPFQMAGDVLVRCVTEEQAVVIPAGVRVIGENAFEGCVNLKSVTLSAKVEVISAGAFRGCANLIELVIPENSVLKEVGSMAFAGTQVDPVAVEAVAYVAIDAFGEMEMPEEEGIAFSAEELFAAAGELEAAIAAETEVTVFETTPLEVVPGEWVMSDDGKSVFIQKPTISGGSGVYTIAYNIYDSNGNAVNYFYSDDPYVAATCPTNGTYNVFVVVRDGTETVTVMTGWFNITAYGELTVGDIEKTMSDDGKSLFIKRPDITGGSGRYTIAYNIYDSDSNPINYFYSNDPYVAATCPYNGLFNVFVVVNDGVAAPVIKDTGWFEVTGYENPLEAPELTSVSGINSATKAMRVDWEPVEGADNYEVQYYQTDENWQTLCFTENDEYEGGDFKSGDVFYFRVRAVKNDVAGEWSEVLEGSRPYVKGVLNVTTVGIINDIQFTMYNYGSRELVIDYYCGFYTSYASSSSHSTLVTISPKTTTSNRNRQLPSLMRCDYHFKPYSADTIEQTTTSAIVLPFTYVGHKYYMQFNQNGSLVWVLRDN